MVQFYDDHSLHSIKPQPTTNEWKNLEELQVQKYGIQVAPKHIKEQDQVFFVQNTRIQTH